MTLSFTYAQKCCFCSKRFKTLSAVQKHSEAKHPEKRFRSKGITFWDNKERLVSVPDLKCLDRRTKDYKDGYLPWLAGLTEQINASFHPCLRGKYYFFNKTNTMIGYESNGLKCSGSAVTQWAAVLRSVWVIKHFFFYRTLHQIVLRYNIASQYLHLKLY